MDIPQLVDETLEHFAEDPSFTVRYWRTAARAAIHEQARQLVVWNPDVSIHISGDPSLNPPVSVFAGAWLGTRAGLHFNLLKATKEQLRLVIEERQSRVQTEQRTIKFLKVVERNLEPNESVEERFSEDQLIGLAEKAGISL